MYNTTKSFLLHALLSLASVLFYTAYVSLEIEKVSLLYSLLLFIVPLASLLVSVPLVWLLKPRWKRSFEARYMPVSEVHDIDRKLPQCCHLCQAPTVATRQVETLGFDKYTQEPIVGRRVICSESAQNKVGFQHLNESFPVRISSPYENELEQGSGLEEIFDLGDDGEYRFSAR